MERYDFKTALEVAVQFFPGIKLNYKERTEIVPRKPAFQTKRRPPQVFAGISDWLFHRPALSIGQKTELSLFSEGLR